MAHQRSAARTGPTGVGNPARLATINERVGISMVCPYQPRIGRQADDATHAAPCRSRRAATTSAMATGTSAQVPHALVTRVSDA